jgi:hypothetical protein
MKTAKEMDDRGAPWSYDFVSPYSIMTEDPIRSVKLHAAAMDLTIDSITATAIVARVHDMFEVSNSSAKHQLVARRIKPNHRYWHPDSLGDDDERVVARMGAENDQWCETAANAARLTQIP